MKEKIKNFKQCYFKKSSKVKKLFNIVFYFNNYKFYNIFHKLLKNIKKNGKIPKFMIIYTDSIT